MEIFKTIIYISSFGLIGYLIGSINFAILFCNMFKLTDVRTVDASKGWSGNPGATNMVRVNGKKWGLAVITMDISKAMFSILIAFILTQFVPGFNKPEIQEWISIAGTFAIVGHMWPIYYKFKGGKGAASFAGMITIGAWPLLFLGIFVFILVLKKTKMVSPSTFISSGTTLAAFILILWSITTYATDPSDFIWLVPVIKLSSNAWWINLINYGVIWCILVFIGHRKNIKKLLNGTEAKFDKKAKTDERTRLVDLNETEVNHIDPTQSLNIEDSKTFEIKPSKTREFTPKTDDIVIKKNNKSKVDNDKL